MGWNGVTLKNGHPLFKDIPPEAEFYFVHSYHPVPVNENHVLGTTRYGVEFPSVIGQGNLVALQFHTEKSGRPGALGPEEFRRVGAVEGVEQC